MESYDYSYLNLSNLLLKYQKRTSHDSGKKFTGTCVALLVTCVGILVADMIASGLPKVSAPGEVTFAPSGARLCVGGHAANVSIDLLKLGLEKGEVSCTGTTGQDAFGDFIVKELEKMGVITHIGRIDERVTSSNMILVVQGEDRRFHVDVGANQYLDVNKVRATLRKERPCILYVGGTGLLGEFDDQLPKILREAKEELNCLTFVDPVIPHERGWEHLQRSLQWVDILHCNSEEAEGITGKRKPTEALDTIAGRGVKLTIITLGDQGLVAKHAYDRITMPAFRVPVVDPTGAGDAFSAGIICYLTRPADGMKKPDVPALTRRQLLDLLLEGEAAGAACVTDVGTTKAVTRENVDRILQDQKATILDQMRIGFKLF
jgi:sugar/nucleoside kinase (ribokinase family)